MRVIRRSAQVHSVRPQPAIPREKYFFYERNTGVAHFHVETDAEGRFPVEQAAGLLAMHCMVRNQTPSDYVVLVEANTSHLEDLTEKAQKLLEAGRAVKSHVKLTRREQEVLNGVIRSLANKEIAVSLNSAFADAWNWFVKRLNFPLPLPFQSSRNPSPPAKLGLLFPAS